MAFYSLTFGGTYSNESVFFLDKYMNTSYKDPVVNLASSAGWTQYPADVGLTYRLPGYYSAGAQFTTAGYTYGSYLLYNSTSNTKVRPATDNFLRDSDNNWIITGPTGTNVGIGYKGIFNIDTTKYYRTVIYYRKGGTYSNGNFYHGEYATSSSIPYYGSNFNIDMISGSSVATSTASTLSGGPLYGITPGAVIYTNSTSVGFTLSKSIVNAVSFGGATTTITFVNNANSTGSISVAMSHITGVSNAGTTTIPTFLNNILGTGTTTYSIISFLPTTNATFFNNSFDSSKSGFMQMVRAKTDSGNQTYRYISQIDTTNRLIYVIPGLSTATGGFDYTYHFSNIYLLLTSAPLPFTTMRFDSDYNPNYLQSSWNHYYSTVTGASLIPNEWYCSIGYIYPAGSTIKLNNANQSITYRVSSGEILGRNIGGNPDVKFIPGATYFNTRFFALSMGNTNTAEFAMPIVEQVSASDFASEASLRASEQKFLGLPDSIKTMSKLEVDSVPAFDPAVGTTGSRYMDASIINPSPIINLASSAGWSLAPQNIGLTLSVPGYLNGILGPSNISNSNGVGYSYGNSILYSSGTVRIYPKVDTYFLYDNYNNNNLILNSSNNTIFSGLRDKLIYVDPTKYYRTVIYIRKNDSSTTGQVYHGLYDTNLSVPFASSGFTCSFTLGSTQFTTTASTLAGGPLAGITTGLTIHSTGFTYNNGRSQIVSISYAGPTTYITTVDAGGTTANVTGYMSWIMGVSNPAGLTPLPSNLQQVYGATGSSYSLIYLAPGTSFIGATSGYYNSEEGGIFSSYTSQSSQSNTMTKYLINIDDSSKTLTVVPSLSPNIPSNFGTSFWCYCNYKIWNGIRYPFSVNRMPMDYTASTQIPLDVNKYFAGVPLSTINDNEWYVSIGYIYPAGATLKLGPAGFTTGPVNQSGLYRISNRTKLANSAIDVAWIPGATLANMRFFVGNQAASQSIDWMMPVFEEVPASAFSSEANLRASEQKFFGKEMLQKNILKLEEDSFSTLDLNYKNINQVENDIQIINDNSSKAISAYEFENANINFNDFFTREFGRVLIDSGPLITDPVKGTSTSRYMKDFSSPSINLATSAGWTLSAPNVIHPSGTRLPGYYSENSQATTAGFTYGSFFVNGSGAGSLRIQTDNFLNNSKNNWIYRALAGGGISSKGIFNIDPSAYYRSVVYFRKNGAGTTGTIYHGSWTTQAGVPFYSSGFTLTFTSGSTLAYTTASTLSGGPLYGVTPGLTIFSTGFTGSAPYYAKSTISSISFAGPTTFIAFSNIGTTSSSIISYMSYITGISSSGSTTIPSTLEKYMEASGSTSYSKIDFIPQFNVANAGPFSENGSYTVGYASQSSTTNITYRYFYASDIVTNSIYIMPALNTTGVTDQDYSTFYFQNSYRSYRSIDGATYTVPFQVSRFSNDMTPFLTVAGINQYFNVTPYSGVSTGEWYVSIGYIYPAGATLRLGPSGFTTTASIQSAVYRISDKTKHSTGVIETKWFPGATIGDIRFFALSLPAGETVDFAMPIFEKVSDADFSSAERLRTSEQKFFGEEYFQRAISKLEEDNFTPIDNYNKAISYLENDNIELLDSFIRAWGKKFEEYLYANITPDIIQRSFGKVRSDNLLFIDSIINRNIEKFIQDNPIPIDNLGPKFINKLFEIEENVQDYISKNINRDLIEDDIVYLKDGKYEKISDYEIGYLNGIPPIKIAEQIIKIIDIKRQIISNRNNIGG